MDRSTKIKLGLGIVAVTAVWYFFLRKKPAPASGEQSGGGGGGGGGMFTPVMPVVPVNPAAPAPSPTPAASNSNVSRNPIAQSTPTNTYVNTGRVRSDVRTQIPTTTGTQQSGGIYTGGAALPGGGFTQGANSGILTSRQTLSGSQIASGVNSGGSGAAGLYRFFSGPNGKIALTLDRIGKGRF